MTGLSLTPEGAVARRIRLAGLTAALLVAALLWAMGTGTVSRPVFDLWQRLSPRPAAPSQVEIVWIDEASMRTMGPWPWPRYLMARLVEKLAADQPRAIGLDMLFSEPDRNSPEVFAGLYPELSPPVAAQIRALPNMDDVFGRVIGKAPVILGVAGKDARPLADPPLLVVEAHFSKPLPAGVKSWGQALVNIPAIDTVALGHGLLNGDRDPDGKVRTVPLIGRVAGESVPGFALELARVALDVETIEPVVSGNGVRGVRLGTLELPTSPDGRMQVPFRAKDRRNAVSALDILYDLPPAKRVQDKVVIVGLSGAGTADMIATPLERQTYGAVVHADAVEAILEGRPLYRPGWAWMFEAGLAAVLVAIAIWALPKLKGAGAAAGAALPVLAGFGGSWLAFSGGLMLDPAGPVLIAAAAGVTMILLLFSKARRDRMALAASLAEQRLAAARIDGELSAAREIQLGMLPPRTSLSGFDRSVELDALIEPARSIGGDFYDAIRLDERHLVFLVGDVTGKGVPAALFMALSKALAKSVLLRDGRDLGAAVTRLNDEIARDNREDMFVTMVFGLLDTATGRLDLCNAGHENPWLVTAEGQVRHLRPEGGPPLSVAPGFAYECESITMTKGDALAIVSDGISEAQDPSGSFFGQDRIAAALKDWAGREAVAEASNALLREVRAFEGGAEATDDLTVLVFRYLT